MRHRADLKWSTLEEQIFLSPEELVLAFSDAEQLASLSAQINALARKITSRAELADEVKATYEVVNGKLGKSDLVFAGLNVGFCWVPLSSLATTPAQMVANRLIRRSTNWLLFLTSLNRRVRGVPPDAEHS